MTRLSRLKLKAPFECFLHRWEQFEAARDAEDQDPTAKEHSDHESSQADGSSVSLEDSYHDGVSAAG